MKKFNLTRAAYHLKANFWRTLFWGVMITGGFGALGSSVADRKLGNNRISSTQLRDTQAAYREIQKISEAAPDQQTTQSTNPVAAKALQACVSRNPACFIKLEQSFKKDQLKPLEAKMAAQQSLVLSEVFSSMAIGLLVTGLGATAAALRYARTTPRVFN